MEVLERQINRVELFAARKLVGRLSCEFEVRSDSETFGNISSTLILLVAFAFQYAHVFRTRTASFRHDCGVKSSEIEAG